MNRAVSDFSRRAGEWRRNFGRRGTVILIVLISLLFATIAMTAFIEKASTDLLVDTRDTIASQLRPEAYSAMETTLAVLEDFRAALNGLRSPAEGWGDPLAFANYKPAEGHTIEVSFEDESAKLSLPEATPTALVNLFKSWNMTQFDSEKLVDALMGWMRKDYVPTTAGGPRPEDYERGELPFGPPQRSLHSFSELASIDVARQVFYDENGQPNELYYRFVQAFSLYRFKDANINGGNPDLLASLGVNDPGAQRRLGEYLRGEGSYKYKGPQFFKSPQDVTALLGAQTPPSNMGTEIRALRVIVTVHEGRQSFRVSAVFAPAQGGAELPEPTTVGEKDTEKGTNPAPAAADNESNPATKGQNRGRNPQNTANTTNRPPTAGAGGDPASTQKSLNYPFTLLEIRENDEIPSKPAPAES